MDTAGDTIVASATPPGFGGVGIVRVSGPDAPAIARRMLGSLPEPRQATYRIFKNAAGDALDAGIALYFPAPASFTGEAVLELQGHGGPVVVAMLVDAAIELGARRARAGEFSERAFLNDKLDLAQAEAIADLIQSGTAQAARAALRSLTGRFSDAVHALVEQLTRLRIHVEAAIDFPDEDFSEEDIQDDIDFLADSALLERVRGCQAAFRALLADAGKGRRLRDGYRVVLVGRPNAGKSSLLNRLSGEDTAIVTEVAGTTRDILRESIDIDGLPVELVDTAGLREQAGPIEAEGMRRAREAMANADAVLWIQDVAGAPAESLDEPIPEEIPVVVVRNKIDLSGEAAGVDPDDDRLIRLSASTGTGVDSLRECLRRLAGAGDAGEGAFTARRRHVEALTRAAAHFDAGRRALEVDRAGELMAEELRLAQAALGEITGELAADDLLGRIFSEFCIGK